MTSDIEYFLGIDTSNYTTSFAVCDSEGNVLSNLRKLLPVDSGEKGLRQRDAIFAHLNNIPEIAKLQSAYNISAVGYSAYPRDTEGSYMPCFLCGRAVAESIAAVNGIKIYPFSHQRGHIKAALYSCGQDLGSRFIAFHLSGGTSEVLLCENDDIKIIGATKDISCGQLIDRAGVMMNLSFPCGREIDEMASSSSSIKPKICVDGLSFNLSGFENKIAEMTNKNISKADIASYAIDCIVMTIDKVCENIKIEYGDIPMLFSGGVSSNTRLKKTIEAKYNAYFAKSEFSCDNAAGISLLCMEKYKKEG